MKYKIIIFIFLLLSFKDVKSQVCFKSTYLDTTISAFPGGTVTGDFNFDHNTDIALFKSTTGIVRVYSGTGLGTFNPQPDINIGFTNCAMASADIDNDSLSDLLFSRGDSIKIYKSNGNGTFVYTLLVIPNGANSICTADFNNDNNIDIVVNGSMSDSISFLAGNGNGTFSSPISSYATGGAGAIKFEQLNNDTYRDLVINAGDLGVYMGDGSGRFTLNSVYTSPLVGFDDFHCIDYTGDGDVDILGMASMISDIYVYENSGSGIFSSTDTIAQLSGSIFAVADFDNDGQVDLASNTSTNSSLSFGILFSDSTGAIANTINIPSIAPFSILTADFNNDHRTDVILTTAANVYAFEVQLNMDGITNVSIIQSGPICPGVPGSVITNVSGNSPPYQFLWNTSDTTSSLSNMQYAFHAVTVTASNGCKQVEIITINPVPEFIVDDLNYVNSCGSVLSDITAFATGGTMPYTYQWNTSPADTTNSLTGLLPGQYQLTLTDSLGCIYIDSVDILPPPSLNAVDYYPIPAGKPQFILSNDFNNDSYPDIAVSNKLTPNVSILLNDGTGHFIAATTSIVSGFYNHQSMLTADFNYDHNQDLLVSNANNLHFLPGNGNGTFGTDVVSINGGYMYAVLADFNNDSILDVASGYGSTTVGLGTGIGTFNVTLLNCSGGMPVANDFNHDGNCDLVLPAWSDMFFNAGHGNGMFTPQDTFHFMEPIKHWKSVDLNGDGEMDIMGVSSWFDNIYGLGNGTFTNETIKKLNWGAYAATSGDLNNDGNSNDLVIDRYNEIYIFPADAIGNHDVGTRIYSGSAIGDFTAADFNKDGIIDLAASFTTTDQVGVFLNCTLPTSVMTVVDNSLKLYPNPTHRSTYLVNLADDDWQVIVYDMNGRILKHVEHKNEKSTVEINLESFGKGIYLVKAISDSGVRCAKVVVD